MQVATVMHPMQHAGGVATYYATPRPTHPHYSSVSIYCFSYFKNIWYQIKNLKRFKVIYSILFLWFAW
jgi:hypothetical protein